MNEKEILEGNKLIAEFMGVKPNLIYGRFQYRDGVFFSVAEETKEKAMQAIIEYVKYATSWDWLMPVVEKIESIGYGYYSRPMMLQGGKPFLHNVQIGMDAGSYISIEAKAKTRLEAAYKAVIEFIKWHNSKEEK